MPKSNDWRNARRLAPDLYWVGESDRRLALFENLFPLPEGVAYNAYLIVDEKTALIDTVDAAVTRPFLEKIAALLDGRSLDYVIVNHMEPDHCACIEELARRYPGMQIVGNAKTFRFIRQFYDFDEEMRFHEVKEGDSLSLGGRTLRFVFAPMVHWPEVMITYEERDGVLFSADAFGSFGAFSGNLFSDETDYEQKWMDEARRYYTNIVGRYGAQVQALFRKLEGTAVNLICPAHGLIWRQNLAQILDKYDLWSRYEPEETGVLIAYASMYGNTEAVMHRIAGGLAERGVKNIRMFDVSKTHPSYLVAETFRLSHLVLGAPTYNGGLYFAMENLLRELEVLNLQNRRVALVGNGTWSPAAAREMRRLVEGMKGMELIGEPFEILSAYKPRQAEELERLIDAVAESLQPV